MMWFEWQAFCFLMVALVLMTYANFKLKDHNAWLRSKNENMAYQMMEKSARIKEQFKIMTELMKKK